VQHIKVAPPSHDDLACGVAQKHSAAICVGVMLIGCSPANYLRIIFSLFTIVCGRLRRKAEHRRYRRVAREAAMKARSYYMIRSQHYFDLSLHTHEHRLRRAYEAVGNDMYAKALTVDPSQDVTLVDGLAVEDAPYEKRIH